MTKIVGTDGVMHDEPQDTIAKQTREIAEKLGQLADLEDKSQDGQELEPIYAEDRIVKLALNHNQVWDLGKLKPKQFAMDRRLGYIRWEAPNGEVNYINPANPNIIMIVGLLESSIIMPDTGIAQ